VFGAVGVAADSTGLMGAARDNLANGPVYAVSVYAVSVYAVSVYAVGPTAIARHAPHACLAFS